MKFDIDTLAPTFSFTAPYEQTVESFRDAFAPYSYAEVEIYYKEELIITGVLMVHEFTTGDGDTIAVSGYGRAGELQNMTLPKSLYPRQRLKTTLLNLSETFCEPFDIGIDFDEKARPELIKKIDKTEIGISENISSFLISLANERGLIATTAADGRLFYNYNNLSGQNPVLNVQSGDYDLEASYDSTLIYSDYLALTSANKNKKTKSASEKLDLDAVRNQTLEYRSSDDGDLQSFLKSEIGRSIIASQDINFVLPFWERREGGLLKPRDIITIKDPRVFISTVTEFVVSSVTFSDLPDKKIAAVSVIPKSALNNEFERFWD